MVKLLKFVLPLSLLSFSASAIGQDKAAKPVPPPAKTQPSKKAPLDIEAFFKEAEEQARDMPDGCKPGAQTTHPAPKQSKPIA